MFYKLFIDAGTDTSGSMPGGGGQATSAAPPFIAPTTTTSGETVTQQWNTEKPTTDVKDGEYRYDESAIEQAIARAMGKETPATSQPVETQPSTPPAPESTPAPTIQPTEIEAKLKEYEATVEQVNALGGLEGLKPYIELADSFTGVEFNPTDFARKLVALDTDRYVNFVWSAVDRHKNDIANYLLNDGTFAQKVAQSDPGYQEYLKLKEDGIDIESLAAQQQYGDIDTSSAEGQRLLKLQKDNEELRKMVDGISQQNKSAQQQEAEQRTLTAYKSYDNDIISGLTEKVQALGWGDDYKGFTERIVSLTQSRFNKDQEARVALNQARHYRSIGNEAAEKRYTNIVQNRLGHALAEELKDFNAVISDSRKYRESVRKQQQGRIEVPGGAASEPALQPKPQVKPTGEFEDRIEANLLNLFEKMKASNQLPPNFR